MPLAPDELRDHLRASALALPDATEDVSCAGTALECPTVTRRGRAFVFLGRPELRLRLGPSLEDAAALAEQPGSGVRVGGRGWVSVRVEGPTSDDDVARLVRWVAESHAGYAPNRAAARRAGDATR